MIPDLDLIMKKIGEIADVQTGYHLREGIERNPDYRYRIVQMKDFDPTGNLTPSSMTPIKIEGDLRKYLLRRGDVIFLSRGQRNFAFHIDNSLQNVIASGIFYVIRIRDKATLPEYLAWYINKPMTQALLKGIAQGSQISMIPKASFERFSIEIPPTKIQKGIVELDRLARREHEILRDLSEKRHELIQAICHMKMKESQ